MKVKELITALQQFDGELEVYGVSDHGQVPEKVSSPVLFWTEEEAYSLREYITTDKEEAEEDGYKFKAVLL